MLMTVGKKLVWVFSFLVVFIGFQNCGQFQSTGSLGLNSFSPSVQGRKFQCETPTTRGLSDGRLRRLTRIEIQNSLQQIFGSQLTEKISSQINLYPEEVFLTEVSEFEKSHQKTHMQGLLAIAQAVGEEVVNSKSDFLPACLLDNSQENIDLTNQSCVDDFVSKLALQIFRRPAITEEKEALYKIIEDDSTELSTPENKIKVLISSLLLNPQFSFHLSKTTNFTQGQRVQVDSYTLASRLSFRVIGASPDQELLDLAASGAILNPEVMREQARRLLNTPMGRRYVRHLFSHWLKVGQESAINTTYAAHIDVDPSDLKRAMQEEALDFAEHIVFEKEGNFFDLLNSDLAFPQTTDLAKVMDTEISSGVSDPKIAQDGRRGLFMRPLLMISPETRTSVIHRGYVFNKQFLCRQIPSPSNAALEEGQQRLEEIDPLQMTAREEAAHVTSASSCMGCHSMINPPGFVMEQFGPVGDLREQEDIFDANGNFLRSLPINISVDGFPIDKQTRSVSSLNEFNEMMSFSMDSQACFGQKLFRFSRLQMENDADNCHLSEVEGRINRGDSLLEVLIQNAVSEDILWQEKI